MRHPRCSCRHLYTSAAESARQITIMAVADGMSESEAARRVGVDRMTVRAWLGEVSTAKPAPLP